MHPWKLFLALLFVTASLRAEEPFSLEKTPGKLPKDVLPRNYTIAIKPDMDARTFTGTVAISVEATKPVQKFMLNSLELEISSARVRGSGAEVLEVKSQLDEKAETLTLPLPKELPAGAYTVELSFAGKLHEKPVGLYVAPYQAGDAKKIALTTQFEATDARRMFPCWDEPVFRATFELTTTIPKKLIAISNMPIQKEQDGEAGTRVI